MPVVPVVPVVGVMLEVPVVGVATWWPLPRRALGRVRGTTQGLGLLFNQFNNGMVGAGGRGGRRTDGMVLARTPVTNVTRRTDVVK